MSAAEKYFTYSHTPQAGSITIDYTHDGDELGDALSRTWQNLRKDEPDWKAASYRNETHHTSVFLNTKVSSFRGCHITRSAGGTANKKYTKSESKKQEHNTAHKSSDVDMEPADDTDDDTFEEAYDEPQASQSIAGPAPVSGATSGTSSSSSSSTSTSASTTSTPSFNMSNNSIHMTHSAVGTGNFNNSHNNAAAGSFRSSITSKLDYDRTTGMADLTIQQQQAYATLPRQSMAETKTNSPEEMKSHLNDLAQSAGVSMDTVDVEGILNVRTTSIPIRYLLSMQRASEAVAIIIDDEGEEIGTGFMISPYLLMTNHHVIENKRQANAYEIRFRFITKKGETDKTYHLNPKAAWITSEILDFTIVAVEDLTASVFHPLTSGSSPILTDSRVFIIGHPGGRPMEVSLQGNILEIIDNKYIRYSNDTEGGSSGSPVFNRFWKCIALHHSGIPYRDANGNCVCKDGITEWTKAMDEKLKKYQANEGTLTHIIYETVLKDTFKKAIDDNTQQLIREMLMQDPKSKDAIQKRLDKMKKQHEKALKKQATPVKTETNSKPTNK